MSVDDSGCVGGVAQELIKLHALHQQIHETRVVEACQTGIKGDLIRHHKFRITCFIRRAHIHGGIAARLRKVNAHRLEKVVHAEVFRLHIGGQTLEHRGGHCARGFVVGNQLVQDFRIRLRHARGSGVFRPHIGEEALPHIVQITAGQFLGDAVSPVTPFSHRNNRDQIIRAVEVIDVEETLIRVFADSRAGKVVAEHMLRQNVCRRSAAQRRRDKIGNRAAAAVSRSQNDARVL